MAAIAKAKKLREDISKKPLKDEITIKANIVPTQIKYGSTEDKT
jgi:hypothetical protein